MSEAMPRLTEEQAAVLSAYTGILFGDFSVMHAYIEKLMGRPVYTLEMASAEMTEEIKRLAKPDLLSLITASAYEKLMGKHASESAR